MTCRLHKRQPRPVAYPWTVRDISRRADTAPRVPLTWCFPWLGVYVLGLTIAALWWWS